MFRRYSRRSESLLSGYAKERNRTFLERTYGANALPSPAGGARRSGHPGSCPYDLLALADRQQTGNVGLDAETTPIVLTRGPYDGIIDRLLCV